MSGHDVVALVGLLGVIGGIVGLAIGVSDTRGPDGAVPEYRTRALNTGFLLLVGGFALIAIGAHAG